MGQFSVVTKTMIFTIFIPGIVVIFVPLILISFWPQKINLGIILLLGIILIILGMCFYLISVLSFVENGQGTPMIFFMQKFEKFFGVEPSKLVVTGLYQHSRNPMYLGVVLIILGEGLTFQFPIIIIWAVIVFLLFHLVVVFLEEPHLRKKHGEQYDNFMESRPRWFGFKRECKK